MQAEPSVIVECPTCRHWLAVHPSTVRLDCLYCGNRWEIVRTGNLPREFRLRLLGPVALPPAAEGAYGPWELRWVKR